MLTDPVEIEALNGRVRRSDLPARDALFVERLLRLVLSLVSLVEHKNAAITRLKRLLFGPRADERAPAARVRIRSRVRHRGGVDRR